MVNRTAFRSSGKLWVLCIAVLVTSVLIAVAIVLTDITGLLGRRWVELVMLVIPIVTVGLFFLTSLQTLAPTIPALFIAQFLLFIYLGILDYTLRFGRSNAFLGVNLALVACTTGVILATYVHGFEPQREIRNYCSLPLAIKWSGVSFTIIYAILLTLGLLAAVVYLVSAMRRAGTMPFLMALSGNSSVRSVTQARFLFTSVPFGGYLYEFYGVILPFLSLVAWGRASFQPSRIWKLVASCVTGITSLVLISAGHRGPVLFYLLLIVVFWGWVKRQSFVNWVPIILLLIVLMFVIMTGLVYGVEFDKKGIRRASQISIERVGHVQTIGLVFVFDIFPRAIPFQHGRTFLEDLMGVLPGRQEGFATQIAHLRDVKSRNNPIGIVGDLYVNFGMIGIAVGMFIFGILSQSLQIYFLRRERTLLNTTLLACLAVSITGVATSSIVGTLFQRGVITYPLVYLVLVWGATILRTKKRIDRSVSVGDTRVSAHPRRTKLLT